MRWEKKQRLSYGRPIAYVPNISNTYLDFLLDFIWKLIIKLFVKGIGEKRIVAKTKNRRLTWNTYHCRKKRTTTSLSQMTIFARRKSDVK